MLRGKYQQISTARSTRCPLLAALPVPLNSTTSSFDLCMRLKALIRRSNLATNHTTKLFATRLLKSPKTSAPWILCGQWLWPNIQKANIQTATALTAGLSNRMEGSERAIEAPAAILSTKVRRTRAMSKPQTAIKPTKTQHIHKVGDD